MDDLFYKIGYIYHKVRTKVKHLLRIHVHEYHESSIQEEGSHRKACFCKDCLDLQYFSRQEIMQGYTRYCNYKERTINLPKNKRYFVIPYNAKGNILKRGEATYGSLRVERDSSN